MKARDMFNRRSFFNPVGCPIDVRHCKTSQSVLPSTLDLHLLSAKFALNHVGVWKLGFHLSPRLEFCPHAIGPACSVQEAMLLVVLL